jgi:hypothetical protein
LAVAQFARFLADWLDVAGLPRAVVVANSMGCQASVDLAVAKPDRVAGLVLVGPTVDPRARSLRSQTARLVLDSLREPLRLDAVVLSDYARVGPRRTLRSARVMLAHRLEERLPLLRVPTLVVRGERDPIVPKEWAEEAAGLVPGGRLVVVPGAAHCAHFTHPEAVARAIADFLDAHPRVERVLYPGLPSHPGHDIAARQMRDFGGMISFLAESEDEAVELVARTKLFQLAESLGGVESLIEHPARMTHASTATAPFAPPANLVRLSVGIESGDDLLADLEAALVRRTASARA